MRFNTRESGCCTDPHTAASHRIASRRGSVRLSKDWRLLRAEWIVTVDVDIDIDVPGWRRVYARRGSSAG
ncbi:hypothetical protein VC279_23030 [Xanthomonas sp. WHRI 10064A]|uniref:hypothetical protein n=1 Tax=unclassified Xanthomonas TaxID=2643310 RepID=UPI002B22A449|nr:MULTISPECIES: hypothetical protein [unclassified Xanthomonas]MEA9590091.1 hypothetical protein [Xanthomonas sp. WHRI 10064B]MEA9617467.1 hypothetical protein [Xanthomonas sp. WHRI 10064A]